MQNNNININALLKMEVLKLKSEGFDTLYNRVSRAERGCSISKNWETFIIIDGDIKIIYNLNPMIKGAHISMENLIDGDRASNLHIINVF